VVAVLAAAVAITLALLASAGDGVDQLAPVNRDTADQQLDDLRQFLRDNTR